MVSWAEPRSKQHLQCPACVALGDSEPKRECCAALQPRNALLRPNWMRVASSRVRTGWGRASGNTAVLGAAPLA